MTPYYQDSAVKIYHGSALDVLEKLPADYVQCCVTSPPYWGLWDYGTAKWEGGSDECDHKGNPLCSDKSTLAGYTSETIKLRTFAQPFGSTCGKCGARRIDSQLGLEKTPEEYVEKMVEVFREVKRVLRDDGTVWLNLGSSMWSDSAKGGSGTFNGRNGAGENYARASRHNSHTDKNLDEPPCDISGKAPANYQDDDSFANDLCDGCRAALAENNSRTDHEHASELVLCEGDPNQEHNQSDSFLSDSHHKPLEQSYRATPDLPHSQDPSVLRHVSSQESKHDESSPQRPADCRHCANCGACLSVLRSSLRDASLCARKTVSLSSLDSAQDAAPGFAGEQNSTRGIGATGGASTSHILDTASSGSSLGYFTRSLRHFKPKDLVNIPFFVSEALRLDGWYLRSTIIWSKKNPMPESTKDRPSLSHEYIFLLSKKPRYYFDQEAVREPQTNGSLERWGTGGERREGDKSNMRTGKPTNFTPIGLLPNGRNIRSVWTIATQPYPEAHFATFPEDLVKPCILAGSRPGDIVMDPFAGSGTALYVAKELGRKGLGIELKADYIGLAEKRLAQEVLELR